MPIVHVAVRVLENVSAIYLVIVCARASDEMRLPRLRYVTQLVFSLLVIAATIVAGRLVFVNPRMVGVIISPTAEEVNRFTQTNGILATCIVRLSEGL